MKKPAEAGLDPSVPGVGRDGRLTAIRLTVQSEAVHIFSFHDHMNRDVHHASRVMAVIAHGCRGMPAARVRCERSAHVPVPMSAGTAPSVLRELRPNARRTRRRTNEAAKHACAVEVALALDTRVLTEARSDVFDYIERFHNPRMQRRIEVRNRAFAALTQLSAKTGQNPQQSLLRRLLSTGRSHLRLHHLPHITSGCKTQHAMKHAAECTTTRVAGITCH